jgi:GNAT superfamily N-acetyltransferase
MKPWILFVGLFAFQIILKSEAWSLPTLSHIGHRKAASSLFMAQQVSPDLSLDILVSKGDAKSLSEAAAFMVDAFWLSTGRLLIPIQDDQQVSISDVTRRNLYDDQVLDLTAKYGERMGKRLLVSCLLAAIDKESGDILGVVGLETSLLDRGKEDILSPEQAESMLKDAVAALGPKQRRLYKDSTVNEIAKDLLPPNLQLISCLSNLAVSPNARRRGIAATLCAEAERVVASEWKFDSLYLKVESENAAARHLYEQKLGYKLEYTIDSAPSFRVDVAAGCFIESEASTLVLAKRISL